jgi:hypothetical protein
MICLGIGAEGGRRGAQKKHKPGKADLLEVAKAKQETIKSLEGTKEGRVRAIPRNIIPKLVAACYMESPKCSTA